jgi:hypothetical protein
MSALPDGWEIPRWNDPAPVPCTKVMLIAWLNARHGHQIPDDARMGDLCEVLETAYDARLPNTGGGAYPATRDCWAFTVKHEREIRGGQLRLIPKEGAA